MQQVLLGGRQVPLPELREGELALPVAGLGQVLVLPQSAVQAAREAVDRAEVAFRALAAVKPEAISRFFEHFARRIEDDTAWAAVAAANVRDVADATARGRAVGRLKLSERMRADMAAGLRVWAAAPHRVGEVLETRQGENYRIERRRAPLGIVAFVFEGRPNVFADGAGVLRSGNVAVMRIGRDAQGTAEAIEAELLQPALREAGLPEGAVTLVRSTQREAGQALFTESRVRLAVARGSGQAVATLGAIAGEHGLMTSLHGTGGAWMYVAPSAPIETVCNAIRASLDRKVCNTLNTLVLDAALDATKRERVRQTLTELGARVHATPSLRQATDIAIDTEGLGEEWEWDTVPELSLTEAEGLTAAVALINRWSPHFVASIISDDAAHFDAFYQQVEAPYVCNGFTRWVDGQWAWERPELGLTNWERGRLLGRSGILSGDDIFSVRDVFLDESGQAAQRR